VKNTREKLVLHRKILARGRVRVMHYHYWIEREGLGGQEKIRDEIS
jgi:hypothetical protein